MRDHGGDLDRAIGLYGGAAEDWIDLSTGINRMPYPVPPLSSQAWTALPTQSAQAALLAQAKITYGASGEVVAVAGAQTAIQLIPLLSQPKVAKILGPTYNEYNAALTAAGWTVDTVYSLQDLRGADLAVVVNPNNPDGRYHSSKELLQLLDQVGQLIVDESFIDATAARSIACESHREGLWILRSFGKFYGLAGVRLGFVLCTQAQAQALRDKIGPWPVSGAAIEIGQAALKNHIWQAQTSRRLAADVARLDHLLPWRLIGGDHLFRLYDTPNAAAAQKALARHHIWSRIFPWSPTALRLGLPAETEWPRIAAFIANYNDETR